MNVDLQKWFAPFFRNFGGKVPGSHLGFDLETTGFDSKTDLIVELGHCYVEDWKVVDRNSVQLNWYLVDGIDHDWLDGRLATVKAALEVNTDREWKISPDTLRAGMHPQQALVWYRQYLQEHINAQTPLLWHSGFTFDDRMIKAAYEECFDVQFSYPHHLALDTSVLGRAMQEIGNRTLWPLPGEAQKAHAQRLLGGGKKRSSTKLSYLVKRFQLDELAKEDLDADQLHTASYDAYLCHLILRRLKQWLEKGEVKLAEVC